MSKIRSDSTWNGVAAEKLEVLDGWLFEDGMGYREVKERIKAEWDMEVSISSLGRYYRDREQEVALGDAADLQETADAVEGAPAKLDRLRSSAWKMIGVRLLERTLRRGNVKELSTLGRLMSDSEWREIQRGRLELAREKFEFNATKAALAQMPKLEESDREEQEWAEIRAAKIRTNLFGRRGRRRGMVVNDQCPRANGQGEEIKNEKLKVKNSEEAEVSIPTASGCSSVQCSVFSEDNGTNGTKGTYGAVGGVGSTENPCVTGAGNSKAVATVAQTQWRAEKASRSPKPDGSILAGLEHGAVRGLTGVAAGPTSSGQADPADTALGGG